MYKPLNHQDNILNFFEKKKYKMNLQLSHQGVRIFILSYKCQISRMMIIKFEQVYNRLIRLGRVLKK